jgi:ribosomal protein L19
MSDFVVKINRTEILNDIENSSKKSEIKKIDIGDTVKLGILIQEGTKKKNSILRRGGNF